MGVGVGVGGGGGGGGVGGLIFLQYWASQHDVHTNWGG